MNLVGTTFPCKMKHIFSSVVPMFFMALKYLVLTKLILFIQDCFILNNIPNTFYFGNSSTSGSKLALTFSIILIN